MKKFSVLIAAGMLAMSTAAFASATATQDVGIQIDTINQIAFTGSPVLEITTAVAGEAPTTVSDTTTATYAITTNDAATKVITAAIDIAMPTGVTLTASLAAPTGGTSVGAVSLTATAANVVTGIQGVNASSLAVSYSLSATSAAAPIAASGLTKTVTYTIADGS